VNQPCGSVILPTRRRVVAGAIATTAAGGWPLVSPTAQEKPAMLTRTIPSSGEKLPVIGLGTWQTFDIGDDPAELAQRRQVLEVLFAAGGRVIDSSPMYGRAEAVTGTLIAAMGARDKAFIATKVWTNGKQSGIAQMKASSEKLSAPVVDLMQIHNLVDWRTHLPTLRAMKAAGTVRTIGITHYTTSTFNDLATVLLAEPMDFLQIPYSLDQRSAETRLLPLAAERGVAVIPNVPFGGGQMFAKVRGKPLPDWAADIEAKSYGQIFLKYLISHPAVTCVIPGTAKPDHMRDNVGAGVGPIPDAAFRQRIAAWWNDL
jgi:diketogulonate reductase-like aldo/keto reductase